MILQKQWDYFAKSFKEKKILPMLFYEGLFFIAVFIIVIILQSYMGDLAERASSISPIGPDFEMKTPADELNFIQAVKIQTRYVLASTLAALLVVVAFLSSRFFIYLNMADKKQSWRFFGKSIMASILVAIFTVVITYLFQALLWVLFANKLDSRLSQMVFFIIISIYFMFLLYLLINFKLRFFKQQAFLKGVAHFYNDNIKGIKNFLIPILFSFLIFIVLNIVSFFLFFIPGKTLFLVVFTLILVLFFAWIRAYYLCLMEKTKPKTRRKRNH
ncbi:hypothetical protein ACFL96_15175 [Thermoproteota archaeon]